MANAARIRWTMNDDTQGTDFRVSRVSRRTSAEDTRIPTRRVEEGEGNRHQYVRSSGEPKEHTQQQGKMIKRSERAKPTAGKTRATPTAGKRRASPTAGKRRTIRLVRSRRLSMGRA